MNVPFVSLAALHKNGSLLLLCVLLSGCGIYKKRILFQTENAVVSANMRAAVNEANGNYLLHPDDFIELKVHTNGGEIIIDPNREIMREMGGMGANAQQNRENVRFLIRENGMVKLPLIGDVRAEGLTLHQLDSVLEQQYATFYEDVFVVTRYLNKRVVVLGATGGQVIPLENENTNLLEILALAGGINLQARADNIRLIRGDLQQPEVHLIDLTTIEGLRQSSLQVLPGDIIYVEPLQRITTEAIRDITPVIGLLTTVLTLALLVVRLN